MMKSVNKIYRRFATIVFLCAIMHLSISAQTLSFKAVAPGVVRTGEQFQLTYTLNEKVGDFTPPDFGEFRYLGGPSQGSSTSINMVNGKTTRVSSYTFTYYIQAPAKAGKYIIPAASASYKRNTINSNKLEIEVVGAQKPTSTQSSSNQAAGGASANSSSSQNIYVQLEFDKRTAYVGEQITAWVKLYAHPDVKISGVDQQFKGPEYTGFFRQDIELPALTSLEREKVGNEIYHVGLLRKVVLYPQKSGEIYIEPFELLVEVQQMTQRRPRSVFDEFFGSQYERKRVSLNSKRVKLNIKPLPGNQPAGFSGAVGNFKIDATSSVSEITTNDAISFKVDVSGKGNIKLLDELVSNFPPTFDVFDPIKKIQLDNNTQGKSGRVSFEYTAIPRHAGNFTIPPFSLVFFDPVKKSYQTISSNAFDIKVNKGDNDSTTVVSGNLSKEAIELLGSDIRFIQSATKLQARNKFIFGRLWFYEIYITAFLLFIGILIIRKERLKRSVDVAKYRNRKAGRIVNKRLKKASSLLKNSDIESYFDELERALWGYLADKLSISVSELSSEKVEAELAARQLPDDLSAEFIKIIEKCQFARYAPGGMESEMSDLFERARTIINKLDQKL